METRVCNNCGTEYIDAYCNHCGQKATHRITLGHLGHDLVHAFTHADKGIVHLFLELFKRPGIVAREYILEGKRKKYFNPVQYLFILASVATFVLIATDFMDQYMQSNPFQTGRLSERQVRFQQQYLHILTRYFNIVLILQIPFFAAASLLVYRKYRLNYAEHLTLHTFIAAQVTVLTMLLMLLSHWTGTQIYTVLGSIISIAYYVFVFVQFFREKPLKGGLKGAAAYILGFIFYMIAIMVVMFISVIVFIKVTPKG